MAVKLDMNSESVNSDLSDNGRNPAEEIRINQYTLQVKPVNEGEVFSLWRTVAIFASLFTLISGYIGICLYSSELRWPLIGGAIVFGIVGFYPLTYLAYLSFSDQTKRKLLKNDFRLLGLVSEDHLDDAVEALYLTVYSREQFIIFICLISVQSTLILTGYFFKDDLLLIRPETMTLLFYAYLGASIFSIQQVIRRYNTFDLQPQVFSSISVRIFMSVAITFL